MRKPRVKARKLIVPVMVSVTMTAAAVTAATTAVTVLASAGCEDDDGPKVDAGMPDTPLI